MDLKKSRRLVAFGAIVVVLTTAVAAFRIAPSPETKLAKDSRPLPAASAADAVPAMANPIASTAESATAIPEATAAAPLVAAGSSGSSGSSSMTTLAPAPGLDVSRQRGKESGSVPTKEIASQRAVYDLPPEVVANRVKHATSTEALATEVITLQSPSDDVKPEAGVVYTTSDTQITTDVKSAIAADVSVGEFDIGVSTTDGVVALTGRVATQGAIDQAKEVAGKIRNVRRVDTSALILASL